MAQKTVFISYRRDASGYLPRAIYMDLTHHGWDAFYDYQDIDSGDFDQIILRQIAARAHFILLISPGSLERCVNKGDWVLREIEEAVRLERNIVPVVEEGADADRELGYLPAGLRKIVAKKQRQRLFPDFFDEAMVQLRTRRLKQPEYVRIAETPAADLAEVQRRKAMIEAPPPAPPPNPAASAMQRAQAFTGQRNRDWEPFVATFPDLKIPDMPFCLVPVGSFQMGSEDGHYQDEEPVEERRIARPYWIGQFPVTNAQWKLGVQAGAVPQPHDDGKALVWYNDPAMAGAPVVGIDWFMARDFAAWLGCRLPSELEWEYAARGVESWRYPWGNDWNPDIPVWRENSDGQPAVVTSRPEGKSWVAAWHMSGNVWEWTNSLYEPYPYRAQDGRERDTGNSTDILRVLRGGSWRPDLTGNLRSACRVGGTPRYWDNSGGFRVSRS